MKLIIQSPKGLLFEGAVTAVSFPGAAGSFDILPQHAPLLAALTTGIIRYQDETQRGEVPIQGGFVSVQADVISVCVE